MTGPRSDHVPVAVFHTRGHLCDRLLEDLGGDTSPVKCDAD